MPESDLTPELATALNSIKEAPKDIGRVDMIVRRPATDQREIVSEGEFDPVQGLIGDTWSGESDRSDPDHRQNQVTLMMVRAIDAIAKRREEWPLAGDQLFVDFDLSKENVPPGTRLQVGSAILEITEKPHTGCAKFRARFGSEGLRFVNGRQRRSMNLRGVNARVVVGGIVREGEDIRKLAS